MNTNAKHLFFDVDNTITRSKSPITPEHETLFLEVGKTHDMIIVSWSKQVDIWGRFTAASENAFYTLAQNGNCAFDMQKKMMWERPLSEVQKQAIYVFIEKVRAHTRPPVTNENDLIEDRGSQIAFSFIGHHERIEVKEVFDPNFEKRKKVLADLTHEVTELSEKFNIEITIGGTTNLDIYEKGKNKGFNTKALCELKGWSTEDCVYFGDALFPGGNDYTVVGVLPTQSVKDYKETYELLKKFL
jgi:HAD superfamily hydrolase (TIGR01484 family)